MLHGGHFATALQQFPGSFASLRERRPRVETLSLNARLIQRLRFGTSPPAPSRMRTARQTKVVLSMLSSRYEKNSARCVRLARESGDAVLTYGLMKMAEAWLELGRNRHPKTLHGQ